MSGFELKKRYVKLSLSINIRHGLSCTTGEGEEHNIDQLHFLLKFLELRFNSTSPPTHAGAGGSCNTRFI